MAEHGAIPFPYARTDAEAFLLFIEAHPTDIHLAIVAAGEPVGSVGMYRRKGPPQFTGELGYWLGPEHWGCGYATEAARALAEHAFAATDIARLEARVFAWNPASCRVLEKIGFQREGLQRRATFKDGVFVDNWLYARLRDA